MSLRQSSNESSNAHSAADGSDRACWQRDRNCICLKIEIAPSESFLFPYQQFSHAQHIRTGDDETLRMSFGEHEIVVVGKRLAEIVTALQELAVTSITATPPRYNLLAQGEGARVARIDIKPLG